MLARGQLRHNTAVGLVRGDLRVDDVRHQFLARAHDGRGSFVARALDAEDVNVAHTSIVRGDAQGNGLSSNPRMKEHATNIVRELRQRGFQAYFAGGCVRDTLLGPDACGLRRRHRRHAAGGHADLSRNLCGRRAVRRGAGPRAGGSRRFRPSRPSTRTTSRSRPFAMTAPTPTAAIPTRCAIRRIRRRTCSAATSPSTAC